MLHLQRDPLPLRQVVLVVEEQFAVFRVAEVAVDRAPGHPFVSRGRWKNQDAQKMKDIIIVTFISYIACLHHKR